MSKLPPTPAPDKEEPPAQEFPPAEEEIGGGDICSLEEQPSTDDDEPLD